MSEKRVGRLAQAAHLEPGSRLGRDLAAHLALQSFQPRFEISVFRSHSVYLFLQLHRSLLQRLRGYHQDSIQIARGDGGGRSNGSDGIAAEAGEEVLRHTPLIAKLLPL